MDIALLKEYIVEHNLIETILIDLQCGHIKYHSSGNYFTSSNPDGDNKQAIVVYNNESLHCDNYTRQIKKNGSSADLFDLVCYIKDLTFFEGLKHVCSVIGLEYYHDFTEDIPESLLITQLILDMSESTEENRDKPLKPIDPIILTYYKNYVNDMFLKDNISYETQKEFGIGYDEQTNRITIPIFSEIGDLVGVKGRLFKDKLDDDDIKYLYLEPTSRARILYGLNKTIDYIKEAGRVYIVEAEKGVLQGYSYGTRNIVATGGKEFSKSQIEMLTRLGVQIVLCLDKDVQKDEIEKLANRFADGIPIYYMYDESNILSDKEAPTDNPDKWQYLIKNNIYKIK